MDDTLACFNAFAAKVAKIRQRCISGETVLNCYHSYLIWNFSPTRTSSLSPASAACAWVKLTTRLGLTAWFRLATRRFATGIPGHLIELVGRHVQPVRRLPRRAPCSVSAAAGAAPADTGYFGRATLASAGTWEAAMIGCAWNP
jgi:hypothetical protein